MQRTFEVEVNGETVSAEVEIEVSRQFWDRNDDGDVCQFGPITEIKCFVDDQSEEIAAALLEKAEAWAWENL